MVNVAQKLRVRAKISRNMTIFEIGTKNLQNCGIGTKNISWNPDELCAHIKSQIQDEPSVDIPMEMEVSEILETSVMSTEGSSQEDVVNIGPLGLEQEVDPIQEPNGWLITIITLKTLRITVSLIWNLSLVIISR